VRARHLSAVAALILAVVSLLAACGREPGPPAPTRITVPTRGTASLIILHTNDLHGQVCPSKTRLADGSTQEQGGFEAICAYVQSVRDEASNAGSGFLLLDSGDCFQGTPEGDMTNGKLVLELMRYAKYDCMAIGNHEFDQGEAKLEELARVAGFPMLCANARDRKTGNRPAYLSSDAVCPIGAEEMKVGVTGVLTAQMSKVSSRELNSRFEFTDEAAAAKESAGNLRAMGAGIVIVLAHVDDDAMLRIANVEGVDVVIGGHFHQAIAETRRAGTSGAWMCRTEGKGRTIGRIDIEFDTQTRNVTKLINRLVTIIPAETGKDKGASDIIAPYAAKIDATMNEVIGKCESEMPRDDTGFKGTSLPLGNLLTDIMRDATGAQVAFHNRTGIRSPLRNGDVTVRDMYMISPFGNTLVTLELSGAQLREVLEYALSSDRLFLEVSGIEFRYDPANPQGKRVLGIAVGGVKAEDAAFYKIVANSYIAAGGDEHRTFLDGRNVTDTGVKMLDAQIEYFRKRSPIAQKYDNRIIKETAK
jgi:5'-nucleotidase/UDP-sugar diphosphatase